MLWPNLELKIPIKSKKVNKGFSKYQKIPSHVPSFLTLNSAIAIAILKPTILLIFFKYITPIKGDISALAGYVDNFFTVEDNGSLLCHYINREFVKYYEASKRI